MKTCPIESIDHNACPNNMACIADPAATMPGHKVFVTTTVCGDAVEEGEYLCPTHIEFFDKAGAL